MLAASARVPPDVRAIAGYSRMLVSIRVCSFSSRSVAVAASATASGTAYSGVPRSSPRSDGHLRATNRSSGPTTSVAASAVNPLNAKFAVARAVGRLTGKRPIAA